MSFGAYAGGLAFFAIIWGAAAISAVLVWRRLLPHLRGAPAAAAIGVVGFAALIAAHLVPGAIGVLTRGTVAATSVALAAALWWLLPRRAAPAEEPQPVTGESTLSWVFALTAVGVISAALIGLLAARAPLPPGHPDWSWYVLPNIARWIQTDSIFTYTNFVPNLPTGTYPNTGDVMFLAGILPWSNTALVRFTAVPVLALTAIATYALGRELRVPRPTAVLVTAVLLSTVNVWLPPAENIKPDGFMLAMFAPTLLFLTRHARTKATSDLVIAGIALGLAFGSRWYGISTAAVVIAVWAGAHLIARRGLAFVLRGGALLTGLTLAVGGVWFVRNTIATGNPLYPVNAEVLGVTILDGPRVISLERFGIPLSDYITNWDVIADPIFPAFRVTLGIPGLLIGIGAATAGAIAAYALLRRRERSRETACAMALAVCAAGIALAYVITPASAQGPPGRPLLGLVGTNSRWLMPAFIAAAGAAAWSVSRLGRGRTAAEALLLVGAIAGASKVHEYFAPARFIAAGAAIVLATAGAAALLRYRPAIRQRLLARPAIAGALVLALLLGLTALGHREQQRFNRVSYADNALEWVRTTAPPGTRIGMAGNVVAPPVAQLLGRRFENEVSWVGKSPDHQLKNYRSEEKFNAALRAGDYDLLMVFRAERAPWTYLFGELRALQYVPSLPPQRWARREGFRPIVKGTTMTLLAREPGAPGVS